MQKINFAYHVMLNKGLWDSISGIQGKVFPENATVVNGPKMTLLASKFEPYFEGIVFLIR